MMPAQCGQGRQHNAGKDANAASAGSSKAKSPWNNAGYDNEATGTDNDHDNNTMHTDVLRLRCGWADTSCNAGGDASAMRAKRPAQRGQQRQCNAGNNNNAMLAWMPVQNGQRHQRNAGKTASSRLAGHEGQVAGEPRRLRQQKPQTTTMSLVTTPHMLMFHDCVVMGQTPVCNAYGNAGAMRVTSPAQQGQRCPCNASSGTSTMPVKTTAQYW